MSFLNSYSIEQSMRIYREFMRCMYTSEMSPKRYGQYLQQKKKKKRKN